MCYFNEEKSDSVSILSHRRIERVKLFTLNCLQPTIQFPFSPLHLSMLCCCERDEHTASRINHVWLQHWFRGVESVRCPSFNGQDCRSHRRNMHRYHTYEIKWSTVISASLLYKCTLQNYYSVSRKRYWHKHSHPIVCVCQLIML